MTQVGRRLYYGWVLVAISGAAAIAVLRAHV